MLKKVFIVLTLVISAIMCTSVVLANNNLGDEIKNSMNKTGDNLRNFGNDILGTDNTMNNDQNNMNNNNNTDNTNATATTNNNQNGIGGYIATRTATAMGGMTDTTWTWLILAIAAIAIVALVWYYATQNSERRKLDEQ